MSLVERVIRIATRSSPLALWQSTDVAGRLREATGVAVELVPVDTLGDRTQALGVPLHEIGGQGVFAKEVQAAVLDGRADIAVHSAKDLPGEPMPGLHIACVPRRDDARDGLVGSTLAALVEGAVVATGSIRRRAQLAALRPDLQFVEVRGNMAKRVAKADEPGIDAVVVGCAGLDRLELGHHIAERFTSDVMLPQVGQAAVAVECRTEDLHTYELLRHINDELLELQLSAERAFLQRLGAGCQLPVGAQALGGSIEGLIASFDGSVVLRRIVQIEDAASSDRLPAYQRAGLQLAEALLDAGGGALLAAAIEQ
jgi:hydroxymethylbilane synthase